MAALPSALRVPVSSAWREATRRALDGEVDDGRRAAVRGGDGAGGEVVTSSRP